MATEAIGTQTSSATSIKGTQFSGTHKAHQPGTRDCMKNGCNCKFGGLKKDTLSFSGTAKKEIAPADDSKEPSFGSGKPHSDTGTDKTSKIDLDDVSPTAAKDLAAIMGSSPDK